MRTIQLLQGEDLTQLQRRIDRTTRMFLDDTGQTPISADLKQQPDNTWTCTLIFEENAPDDVSVFMVNTLDMSREKALTKLDELLKNVRSKFSSDEIIKNETLTFCNHTQQTYWCRKHEISEE